MRPRHLFKHRRWPQWHRAGSAALAVPLVFYAVTGVLLNHRRAFDYFQSRAVSVRPVAKKDMGPLREFVAFYRAEIGQADDPAVIRIKNGRTVEFLYGSHGRVTYVIDPRAGRMTRLEKRPAEPWSTLNRLHKAFETPGPWVWVADLVSALLVVSLLTGLAVPGAWRRTWRHVALWGLAFAVLVLGVVGTTGR
ncbi:MAG: hypothetical protein Kow0092_38550 [Deferrisomatales bacterium]